MTDRELNFHKIQFEMGRAKPQDILELLGYQFDELWKEFDYSRYVEWNRPPQNGQFVINMFKPKGSVYAWPEHAAVFQQYGELIRNMRRAHGR